MFKRVKRRLDIPDPQFENDGVNHLTGSPFSQRYYHILESRKMLPAWDAKEQFLQLVKSHQMLVLQGETGSGKTTQIPQFLVEAGYAGHGYLHLLF